MAAGSMATQEQVDQLTRAAFAEHSLCSCRDAGHALAIAAHKIIEAETADPYHGLTGHKCTRERDVDRVWNGRNAKAQRACSAALWRALWAAKTAGLVRLDMPERAIA